MGVNSDMSLVEKYNPEWPEWFDSICRILIPALGDSFLRIEHVGSTSIPGMVAKPIIDIDIVIEDGRFEEVKEKLIQIGYVHEGDKGIPGREAFESDAVEVEHNLPRHHLYVCAEDNDQLRRHLAFRDFLKENRDYHARLSQLKLALAEEYGDDKYAYMDGKSALVGEITEKALNNQ
jgi:GrpB-like predicted nucleotidyltransferase (UPF0157 family)